jgi:hypothetical protein
VFGSAWNHVGPYCRRWAHDPHRWDLPLRKKSRPRKPRHDWDGHADVGVILFLIAMIFAVAWGIFNPGGFL